MSIQIISSSPYEFFKDTTFRAPTLWIAWRFVTAVKKLTGTDLKINGSTEYFSEDMLVSVMGKMSEILDQGGDQELQDSFGADLYIPSEISIKVKAVVPYSWYGRSERQLTIRSTYDYKNAIDRAEQLFKANGYYDKCDTHLEAFRNAITFSEKHHFPIYWSV